MYIEYEKVNITKQGYFSDIGHSGRRCVCSLCCVEIVVDRIIVKESAKSRIFDSAQTALIRADGLLIVNVVEDSKDIVYSEKRAKFPR